MPWFKVTRVIRMTVDTEADSADAAIANVTDMPDEYWNPDDPTYEAVPIPEGGVTPPLWGKEG